MQIFAALQQGSDAINKFLPNHFAKLNKCCRVVGGLLASPQIENFIQLNMDKIQIIECIEGQDFLLPGESQTPGPADYADGKDTVSFLLSLAQK